MKWTATLFLFCFQNCLIGPSFHGLENLESARDHNRVYYDETTGKFVTIPNFRGNVIKLGDVVLGETKNINSNRKKRNGINQKN